MNTIYSLFSEHVAKEPNKTALVFEQQQLSYAELNEQVLKLCAYFRFSGLKAGQRVAFFAPNGPEYAVVLLAVARMGLAVVPLPISLKGDALVQALKSTPVAAAIAWPTVSKVLLQSNVISGSPLLSLQHSIEDEPSWSDVMAKFSPDVFPEPMPDPEAPYILTMTSGSTGQPKPIVLSQRCKITRALHSTVDYYKLTPADRILVSTPLYHSLAQRGLLMPLILGATTVILPKFNIQQWLRVISEQRISFLFAVSSQLQSLLLEYKQGASFNLTSLKCVVSSSAILNAESKCELLKIIPGRFHECYGASEVGVVTDYCINDYASKTMSVGRSLPDVQVKIIDENSRSLLPGIIGEIACKTGTAFSEYLKLPDLTVKAYDSEGFFLTGDLGYLDEDGFLYFVGRKKEVISSGGINIYPQDIEQVIRKHPDVIDCVAFGFPDVQLMEYVIVVYEQKSDSDITKELRLMCLNELTDYQQPRFITRVDELPRNQMGKILRKQVKESYIP